MIIIIFIIIIYILYIQKKELFNNYNYQGPIIFLQKTDIKKKNCLGEMDYYECIQKHPSDEYYPTEEELKYLNYPNIIKIPQGKKGKDGLDGSPGINERSTYRSHNNNITSIQNKNEDKLDITCRDNINIYGDIKLKHLSKICIKNTDNCINGKDISDIKDILN